MRWENESEHAWSGEPGRDQGRWRKERLTVLLHTDFSINP